MFDKEYWRKREEELIERQNKEMDNVYKEWNNSEVTLKPNSILKGVSKAMAMQNVINRVTKRREK